MLSQSKREMRKREREQIFVGYFFFFYFYFCFRFVCYIILTTGAQEWWKHFDKSKIFTSSNGKWQHIEFRVRIEIEKREEEDEKKERRRNETSKKMKRTSNMQH